MKINNITGEIEVPSQAQRTFAKNVIDVMRLVRDYKTLNDLKATKGRRALDHLTRSGVLLLSGAWEMYVEDVIQEVAIIFSNSCEIDKFPKEVRKSIAEYVKHHKDDLKVLKLAGGGWKYIYLEEIVGTTLNHFHTPKTEQINSLANKLIGAKDICSSISDSNFIDEFIVYRGHIAHRMKGEEYLKLENLEDYLKRISEAVCEIDNQLLIYTKKIIKKRPWNKIH